MSASLIAVDVYHPHGCYHDVHESAHSGDLIVDASDLDFCPRDGVGDAARSFYAPSG